MIDFSEDADTPATPDLLKRAVALAQRVVAARANVELQERRLKDEHSVLQRLEQVELPELMRELGLQSLTLEGGKRIEVVEDVKCGITEANKTAAHEWLRENGFGGLLKSVVSVKFGADEFAAAQACADAVGGELSSAVHPQTLAAFVREQRRAGAPLPEDLLGVFPYYKVKIK